MSREITIRLTEDDHYLIDQARATVEVEKNDGTVETTEGPAIVQTRKDDDGNMSIGIIASAAVSTSGGGGGGSFVGSSARDEAVATHNVSNPSSSQSGDLAVIFLTVNNGTNVTPPSGWTKLGEVIATNNTYGLEYHVYHKTLGGSEPSSWAFGFGALKNTASVCVVYRGYTVGTSSSVAGGAGDISDIDTPTITASDDAVILHAWSAVLSGGGSQGITLDPDGSVTDRTGTPSPSTDFYARATVGSEVVSAGTTTARNGALSSSTGSTAAWVVELEPA